MIEVKNLDDIINQARTYIDTPFLHKGRTKNGLDCGGLIVRSMKDLGYDCPDLNIYTREPYRNSLQKFLKENVGEPIDKELMKKGDIALIRFKTLPHHVAIIGENKDCEYLTLIHSFGEVGKVVEHRIDENWKEKIIEVYRFKIYNEQNN